MSILINLFKCTHRILPRQLTALTIRHESGKAAEIKETIMVTNVAEELEETEEEREERIEKLRNKSRLNVQHRNMVHGRLPYPESKVFYHDSVQYKRRAWARYGAESQVYPGIAWPDKDDLEDKKEYEKVLCPLSIQEMVALETNKLKEAEQFLDQRYKTIAAKAEKSDEVIADFYKRKQLKELEAKQVKAQKDKLFKEIRSHFGFNIDPKDEKFQEMLEIKRKEEAKKRRAEKKKLREEKLISTALELEKQGKLKENKEKIET